MQGDRAIIQRLNAVLTNELTSVNQYFLHARMLENWGFRRLGKIVYEESIGEMKHADKLIKRILFLDGLPNLQDLRKLAVGETVLEALTADLALETRRARDAGRRASPSARRRRTSSAARSWSTSSTDTEEHIDFLETQLAAGASPWARRTTCRAPQANWATTERRLTGQDPDIPTSAVGYGLV